MWSQAVYQANWNYKIDSKMGVSVVDYALKSGNAGLRAQNACAAQPTKVGGQTVAQTLQTASKPPKVIATICM